MLREDVIPNARGDVGDRYYTSNGKLLATYTAPREEQTVTLRSGKIRTYPARSAELLINSNCLMCGGDWWDKPYNERAKSEFKDDLNELISKYDGVRTTEFLNI